MEGRADQPMEVRVLLANAQVGAVIGTRGAHINHIQEVSATHQPIQKKSGAHVAILKAQSRHVEERVMVLNGTIPQIAQAGSLIAYYLQDETKFGGGKEKAKEFRLLVHRSAVGAIIGKSGATIKDIQSQTSSRIHISNEPLPQSAEKSVTIVAAPENMYAVLCRILTQLQDSTAKSPKGLPYVPGSSAPPHFSLASSSSSTLPSPSASTHVLAMSPRYGHAEAAGGYGHAETAGGGAQTGSPPLSHAVSPGPAPAFSPPHLAAAAMSPPRSPNHTNQTNPATASAGSADGSPSSLPHATPSSSASAASSSSSSASSSSASSTAASAASWASDVLPQSMQKIAIPTVCTGCVIGKRGSVIEELRAQSRTVISIANPEPTNQHERVVTITGSSQGIQSAIYLIRQLVEQYQPPMPSRPNTGNAF
eukprot:g53825.t1